MNDTQPRSRLRRWPRIGLLATALATALFLSTTPATADNPAATPPTQPVSGPGGSAYAHTGMNVTSGGSGASAWYVFSPAGPTITSAPISIILHGYGDFSGYAQMAELIKHTVRQGNIVIYPRWQTSPVTPLPIMEHAVGTAVNGIKGALAWMAADTSRPQPQLDKATYFGHSYGGVITMNVTNRHVSLGLPHPAAIMLDEPDGGPLNDDGFDAIMTGVPATTKVACTISDGYTQSDPTHGCYALWSRLGHIADADKDFIRVHTDAYGTPDLTAVHGMSTGASLDAIDYYGIWRNWDALRSCALTGADCDYLNDTPQQRYMGVWSDGTPVTPLTISNAPIV
ncbi:hypothetical protein ACIGBL_01745 [Streptomyces sp. NPDC085614]|uniref:hypothetical protein n=1 Tax=Streptomyces sp. NPDC085614 TaxID=3365733 RepID=UPI0037D91E2E